MKLSACLRVFNKADHGAALVELGLLLPVMMLLVVGAVDFGRLYFEYIEVVNAAHAGAEYGSINSTDTSGMSTAATQSAPDVSGLTVPTKAYGCECSDGTSYSASCTTVPTCTASAGPPARSTNVVYRVEVTTQATWTPLMPWPGVPSSLTLTNTAYMRGNYP
jgi:Flp pilus assembly protein TadG